ncbi:MAG TPA: hypothetical protein VKQ30_25705 [Ktedonobacterales bacterium]|nr:hypothetical protein [Ktedonobacterales bacterium]
MNTLPPPPSGDQWALDVEDAFGEHDIEYWVWCGVKLVPATPEQVARIRDHEALLRLQAWKAHAEQLTRSRERKERAGWLTARLRVLPARLIPVFAAHFRPAPPTASSARPRPAQAEKSSDRSAPERTAP